MKLSNETYSVRSSLDHFITSHTEIILVRVVRDRTKIYTSLGECLVVTLPPLKFNRSSLVKTTTYVVMALLLLSL